MVVFLQVVNIQILIFQNPLCLPPSLGRKIQILIFKIFQMVASDTNIQILMFQVHQVVAPDPYIQIPILKILNVLISQTLQMVAFLQVSSCSRVKPLFLLLIAGLLLLVIRKWEIEKKRKTGKLISSLLVIRHWEKKERFPACLWLEIEDKKNERHGRNYIQPACD